MDSNGDYQSGLWVAPIAIRHLCGEVGKSGKCDGLVNGGHIRSETQKNPYPLADDISNCQLAAVSWAIPDAKWSDHGGEEPKEGHWKESVLYNFPKPYDGSSPGASLVFDQAGNLYGTAATGGNNACANGCGVVFKLARDSGGKWIYSVVHRFNGNDGAYPAAALILDKKGNLYGTTTVGGAGGSGVVFEITQ